jgi:hypothetical protein
MITLCCIFIFLSGFPRADQLPKAKISSTVDCESVFKEEYSWAFKDAQSSVTVACDCAQGLDIDETALASKGSIYEFLREYNDLHNRIIRHIEVAEYRDDWQEVASCCRKNSNDPFIRIICACKLYEKSGKKDEVGFLMAIPETSAGVRVVGHHTRNYCGVGDVIYERGEIVVGYLAELIRKGRRAAIPKLLAIFEDDFNAHLGETAWEALDAIFLDSPRVILTNWDLFKPIGDKLVPNQIADIEKALVQYRRERPNKRAWKSACSEILSLLERRKVGQGSQSDEP